MKKRVIVIAVLVAVILFGGGMWSYTAIEPITACDPVGDTSPLCGWQNPEDLVALPGGRHIIVSEYGGQNGEQSGTLALLDLVTETRQVLYTGSSANAGANWGDDSCLEPADGQFSPHGIHLSKRDDGQLQLLAVQHSGRESVEMFAVRQEAESWIVSWQGCVEAPAQSMLNDVVATPDGGFIVTNMMPRSDSTFKMFLEYMKSSAFGIESGYALSWNHDEGFQQLASTLGSVPNGIEIAPDGETVFVNYSASGEVRRVNRLTDTVEASVDTLPPLDNATWSNDGRLLVAGGIENPLRMMGCTGLQSGSCPGAFAILAVDPVTLAYETIYESDADTPGGAGTVGLQIADGSLLIGTFAGDRIMRVAAAP